MERSAADWAPQLWRDDEQREGEAQLEKAAPAADAANPQTQSPSSEADDAPSAEQGAGNTGVPVEQEKLTGGDAGGSAEEGAWTQHGRARHQGRGGLRGRIAGRRLAEGEGGVVLSGGSLGGWLSRSGGNKTTGSRTTSSTSTRKTTSTCSTASTSSSSSRGSSSSNSRSNSSGSHSGYQRRVLSEAGAAWSRLKHGSHPLRVLFLRRDAKLVHPRQQDPSFMEMRISNQEGVINRMQLWAVERGGGMQVLGRSELRGNGRGGGFRRRLVEGVRGKGRNGTDPTVSAGEGFKNRRVITGPRKVCTEVGCRGKRLLSGLDDEEHDLLRISGAVTGKGSRRVLVEGAGRGKRRLVFFINGTVAAWSFEEQLAAMQWADIIVGPHGAGLTHVLYLRPHSALVEMRGDGDERDHYELLAHVRGLQYVRIPSSGSEEEMVRGIAQAVDFLTTP